MSVELTPEMLDGLVERIALRVVEVLDERQAIASAESTEAIELLDAKAVARRFGVSREFIYSHASDLGGVRLGNGERPRWRFPATNVAAFFAAQEQVSTAEQVVAPPKLPTRSRTRSRGDDGGQLLPIKRAA